MSIKYDKLIDYIEGKGITINTLVKEKVITDAAAKKIRAGKSVNLYHIDSICLFLNLPIEQVVEIILDEDQSSESE